MIGSESTSRPALTVVVPAYQEARRLPATLDRLDSYLRGHVPGAFEVIVVDDGSTDGTHQLTANRGPAFRSIKLLTNQGKGAAVRTGVLASRGEQVLVTDADLAAPIEELPKLEAELERVPIAFGSRALQRELIDRRQPAHREGMGRIFNRLLHLLGVRGIRDTQCGFKLLDGTVARTLFEEMTIDGFAFDVELLLRARRRGLQVAEIPVVWNHVEESRVHVVKDSIRMLLDVVRIRWALARSPKPPSS